MPAGDAGDDLPNEPAGIRPVKRPEPDAAVNVLQARIAEMEIRAGELRTDLDRERGERLQERDRAERLVEEVTSLAGQLARVAEEAGARERGLQAQVMAAEAKLADYRGRPWWRRLAG